MVVYTEKVMYVEGALCKKCRRELGKKPYVLIQDKISKHIHTFHARCQPRDPDVRRHNGMHLEPGRFSIALNQRLFSVPVLTRFSRLMEALCGCIQ